LKQVIIKYTEILTLLDDLSDIDDVTRDNIKSCLAIYANGEILRAFNRYVHQHGAVVTADMIAFFYLHIQMSGAANECLSKTFTTSCRKLGAVLFDETPDGKGAARLSRFAGAHSTSLCVLLQGFTPKLLEDYMKIIEEVLPVIKSSILKHASSLDKVLSKNVEITFLPMHGVDFSSPKFMVAAQQADAGCLLESIKAIDILAPILSEEQQDGFFESASGQALAIMARQVVANNIFTLVKSGSLSPSADFAKLRHYRNHSAHSFVMWEIQNNPTKLRFHCIRFLVGIREFFVGSLNSISADILYNYLNSQSIEIKMREEDKPPKSAMEKGNTTRPKVKNTKKDKGRNNKPASAYMDLFDPADDKLLGAQIAQGKKMRELIVSIIRFYDTKSALSIGSDNPIAILRNVIPALEAIHAIIPEDVVHNINEPLIAKNKGKPKVLNIRNEEFLECYIEFLDDQNNSYLIKMVACKANYKNGLQEVNFCLINALFFLFYKNIALLNDGENCNLFMQTLQKAFDYGASPNVTIQCDSGLMDILSFAIMKDYPTNVIIQLLENGANINQVIGNRLYFGSLSQAVYSRPDIVPHLLQAGANPLDLIYDPYVVPRRRCSIFYCILATAQSPIELRMASLKILYPYVFQKYGEEALLVNMNAPIKTYHKGRIQVQELRVFYDYISKMTDFEQLSFMPAILLHKKVQTVLTNPRFSFYKLVLHDEVGIIRQEIARLGSSQAVLAAMGVNNDNGFTVLNFAAELGLTEMHVYLKQEHDKCLGIKPAVVPVNEYKTAVHPLQLVQESVSHEAASCAATSLSSSQQDNLMGSYSCKASLVGVIAIACTAMLYLVSKYTDIGISR